jgi:molybdate transport system substrate-binding protein
MDNRHNAKPWGYHRLAAAVCLLTSLIGVSVAAGRPSSSQSAPGVLIFAAASLKEVLDEIARSAEAETGTSIRVSYAASSALARQIEAGAPAHIFISADADWMDYLAAKDLVLRDSRVDLVGNRLVLVAPVADPVQLRIAPRFPLAGALGDGRLAVADPGSVPAGKYARAALTSLGVWDSVSARLAPADNVRAALALVARAEAPLGIVYRTDALVEPKVRIVDTFPAGTHPPIVYPAALTTQRSAEAARVLEFLRSPKARAIFERRGFLVVAS